jgi:hypothetical protein
MPEAASNGSAVTPAAAQRLMPDDGRPMPFMVDIRATPTRCSRRRRRR